MNDWRRSFTPLTLRVPSPYGGELVLRREQKFSPWGEYGEAGRGVDILPPWGSGATRRRGYSGEFVTRKIFEQSKKSQEFQKNQNTPHLLRELPHWGRILVRNKKPSPHTGTVSFLGNTSRFWKHSAPKSLRYPPEWQRHLCRWKTKFSWAFCPHRHAWRIRE